MLDGEAARPAANGQVSCDIRVHRGAALTAHILDVSGRIGGTGELQAGEILERRDRGDGEAARGRS